MQRTVASELILGVRNGEGRLSFLCRETRKITPAVVTCVLARAPDAWNSKVAKNSSTRGWLCGSSTLTMTIPTGGGARRLTG